MQILKQINNNSAVARDDLGRICVVFGKGVGFRKAPYNLADDSIVERRFYEIDNALYPLIASLPSSVIDIASRIVQEAHSCLNCTLNPNLPFTLADHLNFALERNEKGILLENPLENEVKFVYPREVEVGQWGLLLIKRLLSVSLPESEAASIALHLVNAEGSANGRGDMDLTMKSTEIIDRVVAIVESCLDKRIDKNSYSYMRFLTHLRFLIARLIRNNGQDLSPARVSMLLPQVREEFPQAAACAEEICSYFKKAFGWSCSDDEYFYLVLHSNQFITGQ